MEKLEKKIDDLARITADGFSAMEKRFDGFDDRFEKLEGKLNGFDRRMDAMADQLKVIETLVERDIDQRLHRLEEKVLN